jgi:hypothetical protein
MSNSKRRVRHSNLKKIPGYPGLFTFVQISRNPRKEKALLEKISRDAARLRNQAPEIKEITQKLG